MPSDAFSSNQQHSPTAGATFEGDRGEDRAWSKGRHGNQRPKTPSKPSTCVFNVRRRGIRHSFDGRRPTHRSSRSYGFGARGTPQGSSEMDGGVALDDLTGLGFLSFDAFLDDPAVLKAWRDEGSMGCIEIKRPHPTGAVGGGFSVEHITTNTSPRSCGWQIKPSMSVRFLEKTPCSMRSIAACQRLHACPKRNALGPPSSLTSHRTETVLRSGFRFFRNFSPRPLPDWSTNTEVRAAPCCRAPLSTSKPPPSIFPSGDMSASKDTLSSA